MSEKGLLCLLHACETLRLGLEAFVDDQDEHTLDVSLGRLLDAARDNRTYNQEFITRYVIWLTKYRANRAGLKVIRDRNNGDPYAAHAAVIVHRDDEEHLPNNYFGM